MVVDTVIDVPAAMLVTPPFAAVVALVAKDALVAVAALPPTLKLAAVPVKPVPAPVNTLAVTDELK